MASVRFRDPAGAVRTGEWTDDGVTFADRTYALDDVDVLPPCEPSKVVCIGRNYAKHAEEFGNEVPDRPLLFLKGPNTLAGHGDTVTLPGDTYCEHEAELAVVVGEQARALDHDTAMDAVAGYTCANDVSNRDDQEVEQNWIRGKAFDGACPLGPVVVDPDEVPDDARIRSVVNGETRQDSSLEYLVFSVPDLLVEITEYITLEPGDVVLTGTPAGVGPLEDGDDVSIEIEGVGRLEHSVERA